MLWECCGGVLRGCCWRCCVGRVAGVLWRCWIPIFFTCTLYPWLHVCPTCILLGGVMWLIGCCANVAGMLDGVLLGVLDEVLRRLRVQLTRIRTTRNTISCPGTSSRHLLTRPRPPPQHQQQQQQKSHHQQQEEEWARQGISNSMPDVSSQEIKTWTYLLVSLPWSIQGRGVQSTLPFSKTMWIFCWITQFLQ